jgi:hypothetical protein
MANKNEEFEKLKVQKIIDVDRARDEGYNRAERRALDNQKLKEARWLEEKSSLLKRLSESEQSELEK